MKLKGVCSCAKKVYLQFKRRKKIYLCIALILICIITAVGLKVHYDSKNSHFDSEFLIAEIQKSSELTTAKLTYKGVHDYKDGGMPIINRSNFYMIYTATLRGGIDIKDVDVDVDDLNKTITISIPKAKVLDVKVDPSSIKYIGEELSLFNANAKEDSDKAKVEAEAKAREEFSEMGFLETADAQAETLLKGIVIDLIPKDYNLEIVKKDE